MPTYRVGYQEGQRVGYNQGYSQGYQDGLLKGQEMERRPIVKTGTVGNKYKPKRKLSAWNKFVKANSKKKIYRYANGKLKLKKMGIAFRKKRRR
jgi:flagellar biosynthesis/type III secretory pathway protein FliH